MLDILFRYGRSRMSLQQRKDRVAQKKKAWLKKIQDVICENVLKIKKIFNEKSGIVMCILFISFATRP